ncbi:MAG TPA: flagellar motor protein MotB [Alphaproteobacteria bacterium]|nr:flagellar motor protein MotB [Alphaproteobacteria bacterium]
MHGKKKGGGGGAHGGSWVISFADLMSLLMAFFVMLLSFSVQDQEKLNMAAGSVQDAFGIQPFSDMTGMIERQGNPERDYLKHVTSEEMKASTEFATEDHSEHENQGQEANTFSEEETDVARAQQFALAAASLKQAWQDLPEITAVADNIIVEETEDGLNIVIADQDGRAMFPEGSKYPYEVTRKAIAAMAPLLQKLPNQVRITGHTAAGGTYQNPRYGPWELSFDRANVTRQILEEFGLSSDRIQAVVGRADTDPFFPNDPYLSANQRVSIELIYEEPPVPADLAP